MEVGLNRERGGGVFKVAEHSFPKFGVSMLYFSSTSKPVNDVKLEDKHLAF